jgi:hypothetical protein
MFFWVRQSLIGPGGAGVRDFCLQIPVSGVSIFGVAELVAVAFQPGVFAAYPVKQSPPRIPAEMRLSESRQPSHAGPG